jgi:hypothetical protein
MELLHQGGIFAWIVTALGIITLALNVAQLRWPRLQNAIIGFIVTMVLLGVCGTAFGVWTASLALAGMDPAQIPDRFSTNLGTLHILGIACTTTVLGTAWAALNSLIAGVIAVWR